jgi:uncharacterized protein (TIGR03435 family)
LKTKRNLFSGNILIQSVAGFFSVAVPIAFSMMNAATIRAQVQSQDSPVFQYEVATIKPSAPMNFSGGRGFAFGMQMPPDGFSTANFPLKALIQFAYGVQNYQISGGPDWISTEHFDIDAKMDSSVADALAKLSPEDRNRARQHMLQLLLEDRFHLTIHRDTKDLPVYTLVIAKNGPKLQESKPGDTPITAPKSPNSGEAMQISKGSIQMNFSGDGMRHISGPAISTAGLATMLSAQLGRPVFDKTGLTGKYDVTLQWAPDQTPSSPVMSSGMASSAATDLGGASIFTAIQEQLGLKLEAGKGPVETIVIDHVEKPSGN